MDAEAVRTPPPGAAQTQDSPMRPQVPRFYYKKRTTGHVRNGNNDSSPKIQPPSSPVSLSTSAIPTYHAAGGFYEIDHDMLPPKSPIHLKSIRVVKVSEYTSHDITVSFPSLQALRSFFSSLRVPSAGPELDERFVMSSNHAARILRRRVAEQELEGEMHQDSFWLVNPCVFDFSASSGPATAPDALSSPEAPPAPPKVPAISSCLLATLKCDGAGWGVRRRVRYIGRHRDVAKEASIGGYETEASVRELPRPEQEDERRSSIRAKRKRDEAEGSKDKPSNPAKKKKSKTYKSPKKQKKRHVESKDGDPRRGKDRWSAERYAAAEKSLLEIMRSSGASLGAPVMRQALREQARKRIGDTGLLDHLLKHMAGRVPDGSTDRFRRRHNADGAMEYWLEPAELAEVRRQAGVSDPYWVPPPGWKPGDDVSTGAGDLLVKRQTEELAEELNDVKRNMEQLSSNMVELGKEAKSEAERAYSSWKEKYQKVVKANEKLEKQLSSLKDTYENVVQKHSKLKKEVRSLKDKYDFVVEKNDKLEEQMASLSSSFLSLKEQFLLAEKLKSIGIDEVGVAQNEGRRALDYGGGEQSQSQSQSRQRADVQAGEKRTARKSSFRICKPQGTFLWPSSTGTDMSGSGGGSSGISMEHQLPRSSLTMGRATAVEVVIAEEEAMMGMGDYFSTPPSASSTTNAGKLLALPSPKSPLQPQPLFTAGFTVPALHHPFAGLTLRHMDSPSSPCGASLMQGGIRMAMPNLEAGGMSTVGTDLALATPSYC
ncbi:protein AMEIOTIC 1 homolog isoform X1 [Hordeum vulgare subsp. vulgare]|uniref:protein AMEIOTIC 1 homolog isoform X1 n=1 Tax=Hordeum vulgare subsp. vulgare TaxID=112509 RepID=UPI001D1A36A5|nr:protein AMEIOTIC 1 homolog isoform X1 [Hordeum vulgare subsp. vulgare]